MGTAQCCCLRYRYDRNSSTFAITEDELSIEGRNAGCTWDHKVVQFAYYTMAQCLDR
jgi:hypothetical protein